MLAPAAPYILEKSESLNAPHAPFHVLAVGKCKAVQTLLERIVNAGPQMALHTLLPDASGLCALHGQALDLIFVDADSPHYLAARLCHDFKHNLETRTVPLIVVSASAKACENAVAQGADDFATPQTLPALLLRRIEALVHVRRARQLLRFEDEGVREPQFPPLEWKDRVPSELPLTRVQLDYAPSVSNPAVVLFADLRGYTHMCECLAPGQVVVLLREHFALLTQITLEHRGVVFEATGDCLMAGFDLSHGQSDAPNRALQAAQMMMGRFASLADSWLLRFHVTVGLGVGLNTGEVATAPMGFPLFTHYTLIGGPSMWPPDCVSVPAPGRSCSPLHSSSPSAIKEARSRSRRSHRWPCGDEPSQSISSACRLSTEAPPWSRMPALNRSAVDWGIRCRTR